MVAAPPPCGCLAVWGGSPSAGPIATHKGHWARPVRLNPCAWRRSNPAPICGGATRAGVSRGSGPTRPWCGSTCWRRWKAPWPSSRKRPKRPRACTCFAWRSSTKPCRPRCLPRRRRRWVSTWAWSAQPGPRRANPWPAPPRAGAWVSMGLAGTARSTADRRSWPCPNSRSTQARSPGRNSASLWPMVATTGASCGAPMAGCGCRRSRAPGAGPGMSNRWAWGR